MYRKKMGSIAKHFDFLLLDLFSFSSSLYIAFFLRQNSLRLWETRAYRILYLLIALLHICIAIFSSCYKSILKRGPLEELFRVLRHTASVLGLTLMSFFFVRNVESLSRLVVIYTFFISLFLSYALRMIWKKFLQHHLQRESRQLLLVANADNAQRILKHFERNSLGLTLIGLMLMEGGNTNKKTSRFPIPVITEPEKLQDFLLSNVVDEVLFSLSPREKLPEELIRDCQLMGLTVHLEYAVPEEFIGAEYEKIAGLNVLTSYIKEVSNADFLLKRAADILGGLAGLLFTAVITLFLAPAIYLADPGPIFFSQKRVGKNGRIFRIYKFRSMYQDAEKRKAELMSRNEMDGLMFKMEADPRVIGSGTDGTRHGLGHFIRASSLDEFPQFWNVLRGDMSLVGTRPPTVEEFQQYDMHHRARLSIKPGITGLWQISGRSDIKNFEDVVKLDVEYIQNWSPALDIKILLRTIGVVLLRKGSR